MCVQSADDHCVLQFTLILAAGCVLHRRTSRVIHRQELSGFFLRCCSSWGNGLLAYCTQSINQTMTAPRGQAQSTQTWPKPPTAGAVPQGDRAPLCSAGRRLLPWPFRPSLNRTPVPQTHLRPSPGVPGPRISRRTCTTADRPVPPPRTGEVWARQARPSLSGSPAWATPANSRRRHWAAPPTDSRFSFPSRSLHPLRPRGAGFGGGTSGFETAGLDLSFSVMILPQVHLRKPCYDFYFL